MQRPLTTSNLSPLLQSLLHQEVKSLRRILVRGVNWLGDAVMTTPALMRLRETCPEAEISLLTHAKLADLYSSHPAINHLITFQEEDGIGAVAQSLRSGNFELAVVLPNSPRSALEVLFARIRRRIGYAGSWRRVFLTAALPCRTGSVEMHKPSVADIQRLQRENRPAKPIPESAHQIYHYLNLMAALGCNPEPLAPVLMVPPEAINQFTNKFGLNSQEGKTVRWLGLNPGAEYGPAKRWPGERFVQAAIEITRRTGCQWLVFGIKNDLEMTQRITDAINAAAPSAAINLAGKTGLGELCAGLKFCDVVLTNDSGPMHVAAALGTPVVVPFGSTSPELTGPGLPSDSMHNRILRTPTACAPCFLRECPVDFRCMKSIEVSQAVDAVVSFL